MFVCWHPVSGTCVWLICMCVSQTKQSSFTSLIVSQSVFFGLMQNKSHWWTCVFKSFNEKMRGERQQQNEVVNYKSCRGRLPVVIKKDGMRQWALNMHNITPQHRWSPIKAIFITIGAFRPEMRSASAETGRKKITSLITKGACVRCEGDGNRTNWLFSDLNLGLNSHDELVREMPLRHVCRTDSVKISLLIYIIIDLQRTLLQCSLIL